jgi:hypothetical protein
MCDAVVDKLKFLYKNAILTSKYGKYSSYLPAHHPMNLHGLGYKCTYVFDETSKWRLCTHVHRQLDTILREILDTTSF